MNSEIMNSENIKTTGPYRLVLNLTDKMDLQRLDKIAALSELSIYYIWKILKNSRRYNKFEISGTTFDELPDGSYSLSGSWNCFHNTIKKHETLTH